jgi:hypothetical protein
MTVRILALAIMLASFDAAAQATSCSKAEAINGETAASGARTWDALYDAFHRFGHCDDGAIAEGFSDSVVRLLASRWQDLHEFEQLSVPDRRFRAFVLRHIDSTANERDLRRIVAQSSACPSHARPVCRDIDKAARDALREMGK